jgi:hypothetical protein
MPTMKNILNFTYHVLIPCLIGYFAYASFTMMSPLTHIGLTIFCILLALWATLDYPIDKLPDQPVLFSILGIFLTITVTLKQLEDSVFESPTVIEGILSLFVGVLGGILLWLSMIVIISGLITSMTDIQLTANNNINDPYNDPHAARILDNDN